MASSTQHHRGDGTTLSIGHVSHGQRVEQGHRAMCGGDLVGGLLDDLVIELEAVVEVGSELG